MFSACAVAVTLPRRMTSTQMRRLESLMSRMGRVQLYNRAGWQSYIAKTA
jgi:hypothetical protein